MTTTACLLFTSQRGFASAVGDLQLEARPDVTLDEGVREQSGQSMNRSETRAVGGDNDGGCKGGQSVAGLLDERLRGQTTEVETTDDGVDLLDTGQLPGIAHDIDDARMTASGQDHEPFLSNMEYNCLVIQNEGVPFPLAAAECLLPRHTTLESRRPVHFPGHQQGTVE